MGLHRYVIDGVTNGDGAYAFASSDEYGGIGLSIAKAIVQKHTRDITASAKDDTHIGFRVMLKT